MPQPRHIYSSSLTRRQARRRHRRERPWLIPALGLLALVATSAEALRITLLG